jgi:hypothetical protein
MKPSALLIALKLLLAAFVATSPAHGQPHAPLDPQSSPLAFPAESAQTRPWTIWWWMGSAVDPANLTRRLEDYTAAGLGGVHIVPIYGVKGNESRNIPYLSDAWLAMLKHTATEANRLGLGVDMSTGTGWCFGGPHIPNDLACAKLRITTIDLPPNARPTRKVDPAAADLLIATSPNQPARNITDRIGPDGSIDFSADANAWKLHAVVPKRPAINVKRAAPGGQGPMLDPFSRAATPRHLHTFDDAFSRYDGPPIRGQYHDSYEYFGADWSRDLLPTFQQFVGYRLEDHLPALLGEGDPDTVARIKADYRRTLAFMLHQNFISPWTDWSARHGWSTRNQAHGSPGNLLDLYAAASIPETEMFRHDRDPLVSKFASSAAHVVGRPLVSSETGTWLTEHFNETLAEAKHLVDELFISGVNHIFYHGTCYSPDDAAWPGWLFYASMQMNERNAIWLHSPTLHRYISRSQAILQHGHSDNDLLVYWPIEDLWHNPDPKLTVMQLTVHTTNWLHDQRIGHVARTLWQQGHTFDYISDAQLQSLTTDAGRLRAPGGTYRAIVVPRTVHMHPTTLRTLLTLAQNGATVIFDEALPTDVPGFLAVESRRDELRNLITDARAKSIAITVGDLLPALQQAGIERETLVDSGLHFIRRSHPLGRHYFLVNSTDSAIDDWVPLTGSPKSVALLDPLTGSAGLASLRHSGNTTLVRLQLAPRQSIILRTFTDTGPLPPGTPAWPYLNPIGDPIPLTGPWSLTFTRGGPTLPPPATLAQLASWTDLSDDAAAFAGSAEYRLTFDAPASPAATATTDWLLDLGSVCHSAKVTLNGRELATLIAPPYRLSIGPLQPTGNELRIEVVNTSANRLRHVDRSGQEWKIFDDINIVSQNYKTFAPADWPIAPSGLIGPVTIRPLITPK